jgi:ABC-2 type transport system permease protein
VLPWSLPNLLDSGQFWGAMLVGILAASAVSTEYSWGTVRQAIVRGQSRVEYLALKLLGLTVVARATLLVALAVGLLFAVLATVAAGQPVTFEAPGAPGAGGTVLMVLRAGYAIIPYGLFAFMLTVVSRSTVLGVGGSILYVMLEAMLLAIFEQSGGAFAYSRAFFIGHNALALVTANQFAGLSLASIAPRQPLPASDLPDPAAAAVALALYSAAFLAISFTVFQRRDLGTDGGAG